MRKRSTQVRDLQSGFELQVAAFGSLYTSYRSIERIAFPFSHVRGPSEQSFHFSDHVHSRGKQCAGFESDSSWGFCSFELHAAVVWGLGLRGACIFTPFGLKKLLRVFGTRSYRVVEGQTGCKRNRRHGGTPAAKPRT